MSKRKQDQDGINERSDSPFYWHRIPTQTVRELDALLASGNRLREGRKRKRS
jgi:hypothetical protein